MLEQHEVAAYLLARRLVRRRSIVSGSLPISDASSRNRNFRVSGGAGESLLLKRDARRRARARLVARAARLGDELVAAARRSLGGWCWPPASDRHGLCGMARGAAGAAWALLELSAATGDAGDRLAAERAPAYARHRFDPAQGDRPDLRGIERREPRGAFGPPSATGWCHGAAGIALSRLRTWRILEDDASRSEALIALSTTAAQTERALLAPRVDFTLRHGLAGHADVLLLGAGLLPEGAALARASARSASGAARRASTAGPAAPDAPPRC